MKRFLIYCLKITVICVFVLLVFGYFENKVYQGGSYYKSQWINQFHEDSFDLVFVGNSRGALFELDSDSISYLNLSEDGSGLKTTFSQLYLFFKNGNRAKQVFLDVDVYSLRKTDDEKRSPRWLPFFGDSTIKATLKNEHVAFRFYEVLPALSYAAFKYDWNMAALANNTFHLKSSPWGEKGFMYSCAEYVDESPKGLSNYDSLPPDWPLLDKIHTLCRDNGAELVLFTSPYYVMLDEPSPNPIFTSELAKRGLRHVDHSRIFLHQKKYFRDNRHLNCEGVRAYVPLLESEVIDSRSVAIAAKAGANLARKQ